MDGGPLPHPRGPRAGGGRGAAGPPTRPSAEAPRQAPTPAPSVLPWSPATTRPDARARPSSPPAPSLTSLGVGRAVVAVTKAPDPPSRPPPPSSSPPASVPPPLPAPLLARPARARVCVCSREGPREGVREAGGVRREG